MSPISFSEELLLLGLSCSQYLIGRSSLVVYVDNTKLSEFFQHLISLASKTDKIS